MTILLDECCPNPLKPALEPLNVVTAREAGCVGVKNGDLLKQIDGKFDVLITADKNLRYQQNLKNRRIAIIELPLNSWKRLATMVDKIKNAISAVRPGDYTVIE